MKRAFLFIICLNYLLVPTLYGQGNTNQAGLSLDTYELPTYPSSFTNFTISNYYQPDFSQQKSVPSLALNKKRLKKDKLRSLLVNTLYLFNVGNTNNFGSIGLPSPAFNPLITTMSSPNDYLMLQQHDFQRNKLLPTFIAAPRALQLRF